MENSHTLTTEEKDALKGVVSRGNDTVMLMHGNGEFRQISFYAGGTRLEARINYPEAPAED